MPKTKISEFSATPGNNTDIDGINIAEGCAPSGINDAIRELMAQLKDFQAGTAGDSFNGPVGTTTAAAGAFTTLSASSTVSGAGFSTYLASPPAIGGTAAAAGSFTTLSASGTLSLTGGLSSTSSAISYAVFSSSLANGGRLEIKDGANLVGYIGNGANSIGAASASEFCVNGNSRILFGIAGNSKLTLNSSSFALDSTVSMTVNSGTANGVAYLNGSKVLTTGSELTTNGSTYLTVPPEVYRTSATSYMRLSGGDGAGSGANIIAFGQSHATAPGRLSLSSVGTGDIISNTISGTHIYQISGTEQMRLTSTGLGIGTSSPATQFVVSNAGAQGVEITGSNGAIQVYNRSTSAYGTMNLYANTLYFRTGASPAINMTLDSSGNLGIGTSSPAAKLHVSGGRTLAITGNESYSLGIGRESNTNAYYLGVHSTTNPNLLFSNNAGTTNLTLTYDGNLGLGVTPSAWGSTYKAIQILGYGASLVSSGAGNTLTSLTHNSYYNGTNWIYHTTGVGAARYEIDGPSGGATFKWYTAASGTAGNAITFTQAMTLDASGNLGVGQTSPGVSGIDILKSGGTSTYVRTSDGTYTMLSGVAPALGGGVVGTTSNHALLFYTNNTERARITSAGNFCIGSSEPGNAGSLNLSVGNPGTTIGGFQLWSTTAGTHYVQFGDSAAGAGPYSGAIGYSHSSDAMLFLTAATERARITSGGEFLVGTTTIGAGIKSKTYYASSTAGNFIDSWYSDSGSAENLRAAFRVDGGLANYSANNVNLSDRREKTNFAPAKSYIDVICAIPVQTFNFIGQTDDEKTLGVVAQDVQAVAPELVSESNWGTDDNPKMRLGIYQTDLQYALMKCIQEQQVMINELKAKVAALEAK